MSKTPDSVRHLSGPCDGMRVHRFSHVAELVGRDGRIVRAIHCLTEHGAQIACFELAEEAYRQAEAHSKPSQA